jgi:trehalose 6-phosphate synthase/phosphatase
MGALPKADSTLWFGWPGIPSDNLTPQDKRAINAELAKHHCVPIYLTQQQVTDYYEGYSNSTLWPLFHYFPQHSNHDEKFWNEYKKVNQVFAKAILKRALPDATIWINDYHLMVLPRLLRKSAPNSAIGFFLHIPFPSYEIFRQLPHRKDILAGLLGADLVGFHIYDYAVHFASSVERLLGYERNLSTLNLKDRTVYTDAFPIGIDYNRFATADRLSEVKAEVSRLRKHYKDKSLVLSMDRLDYSKGILNRLEAFDAFLERNPSSQGKVVLMMVAIPSRTEIDTYQNLRDQVEQTVGRINGQYGTVDWTPITYQYKNLPFEQITALYLAANVALVTPMRDGMNLVAKEYLATKQRQPGVLIISEMAGAVDELPEATKVNPNDTSSMVRALERAISMPLVQQRRRLRIMQSRLSKYTVKRWAEDFIEQLTTAHARRSKRSAKSLGRKEHDQLILDYEAARNRLVLLDYDGTLAEYVTSHDPTLAKPTPRRRDILRQLGGQSGTTTAIMSGRSKNALEGWFGDTNLILSAEHGAWIKREGEWGAGPNLDVSWKQLVMPILSQTAERTPGSSVEEKDYALVWHYRNVTPDLAYVRATKLKHDLKAALKDSGIEVYEGHKIIEIKHRSVTKDAAARSLMQASDYDFFLAIGDDYNDEDMYSALPASAYTIKVGSGETKARFSLGSVEAVVRLLGELSKIDPKLAPHQTGDIIP